MRSRRLPRAHRVLQHFNNGPERDSLAVVEAAAAHDFRVEVVEKLCDEPRFPDAGRAEEGEQVAGLLSCRALVRLPQLFELAGATDERRIQATCDTARRRIEMCERERRDRLGLALRRHLARLCTHRVTDEPARHGADQHLAGLSSLLEPRGHVDGVAGDERVALARNDLAGVDTDARLEAEVRDGAAHFPRGADRAQGVVLSRNGDAEDGHDRVADEFLDSPAMPLEDRSHLLVVAAHRRAQRFGVGAIAERRRPGEVTEDNRDDLARLARGLGCRGSAALGAELEGLDPLVAAVGAGHHRTNLLADQRLDANYPQAPQFTSSL
jgi:hypothetical protein